MDVRLARGRRAPGPVLVDRTGSRAALGASIGVDNFRELYTGGEQSHFLGVTRPLTPLGWLVFAAAVALLLWGLVRAWQAGTALLGMVLRLLGALLAAGAPEPRW